MRKGMIFVIALAGILLLSGIGVMAAGQIARSNAISEDAAKNFALVDAEVSPQDAVFYKADFEYSHGRFIYEIEFQAGDVYYDYDIDAATGSVIERESETVPAARSTTEAADAAGKIGLDAAKQAALTKAGLTAAQISGVVFTEAKEDREDGRDVYEIDFYLPAEGETVKYEYEIDAFTGKVLSESIEHIPETETKDPAGETSVQPPAAEEITLAQAKEIVLADAGAAGQVVNFTEAKRDTENGIAVYEITFLFRLHKYDYDIAAADGKILDKEVEELSKEAEEATTRREETTTRREETTTKREETTTQREETTTEREETTTKREETTTKREETQNISLDQAKAIALKDAGLSASQVTFTKAKQEYEDGRTVYEIDFYVKGEKEYDYEIDAVTGKIIDRDIEAWEEEDD